MSDNMNRLAGDAGPALRRLTHRLFGMMKRHPIKSVALSGVALSFANRYYQRQANKNKKKVLVLPFYKIKIVEQCKPDFLSFSSSHIEMPVDELVELIHQAAEDPNIVALHGIFGNGFGFSSGGWAHLEEIRNALAVFEQSHRQHPEPLLLPLSKESRKKKPMIAYSNTFSSPLPKADMKEYYLASAFSNVLLQTQGDLNLFGLSATNTFFRDCLQRYGIQVDVFKHGLYKNFANQFTHANYSKEHKQNVANLVTQINQKVCESIYISRNLSENYSDYASFWDMVHSAGSFPAEIAHKIGFVDGVLPLDPLDAVIASSKKKTQKEDTTENDYTMVKKWAGKSANMDGFTADATISIQDYAKEKQIEKLRNFNFYKVDNEKIAVLKVTGAITEKTAQKMEKALKKLKKADDVKALILRIDSPGGSITACETIFQQLQDTGKKTVVSFGNVSASGGYYISTHADRIFASPTTITGSIGVFMIRMNLRGLAEQYGITFDSVQSSDLSGSFDPFTPINEPMKVNFANFADRAYMRFKSIVSDGRKIDMDDVEQVAQGKVWTGEQAKELGLVDELGGLHRAIAYCQRSFTRDGQAEVVTWPPRRSFWELLTGDRDDLEDDFLPSVFALVSHTVSERIGISMGTSNNIGVTGFLGSNFPTSVSGIMLTVDENWAIRCLLQENDNVPDLLSQFPPSIWD
jgi:protease-4